MNQILQYSPLLIFGILMLLLFTGRVRFGYGLGDLFYYGAIALGLIIYGIYIIASIKNPEFKNRIFPIIFILLGIYLFLCMTIWRGHESRWDGNILYKYENRKSTINTSRMK